MHGAKAMSFRRHPSWAPLLLFILVLLTMVAVFAVADSPDFSMSKHEMVVAAGYYTEGGKYIGGVPRYSSAVESYECLAFISASNGTTTSSSASNGSIVIDIDNAAVCMQWSATERSDDEAEVRLCTCRSPAGDHYCESWTCAQIEKDDYASDCGDRRRLDSGAGCYLEVESVQCAVCGCDIEHESTNFCAEWGAVGERATGRATPSLSLSCEVTYDDGNVEEGYHTCVKESASGLYCEAWTGDVDSPKELELTSCDCSDTWNGDGVCSFWTCEERGLDKCTLCNLTVAIAAFGLFGMIGVLCCASGVWTGSWAVGLFDTLWACMFVPGVVIWGGQDGCMYVRIAWASFLALVYLLWCVASMFKPRDISTLSIIPAQ